MKKTILSVASLAFVVLLLAAPNTLAQQPGAQQETVFQGEFVRVDTEAQTIIARSAEGEMMTFAYNADTEITGGVNDVQGLSNHAGAQLRIAYQAQGDTNLATRIELATPPEN